MSDLDTLKLKVDVQGRLIRMLSRRREEQTFTAAHLLAHQQARGIRGDREFIALDDEHTAIWLALDSIAEDRCIRWPESGDDSCDCHPCRARKALAEVGEPEKLTTLRAENERLHRANVGLVAQASSREHERKQLRAENERKDAEIQRLTRENKRLLHENGDCDEICSIAPCRPALGEEVPQ